jgi:hypothetical protein
MRGTMEEVVRSVSFISDPLPTIALGIFLIGGVCILWFLGKLIRWAVRKLYHKIGGNKR